MGPTAWGSRGGLADLAIGAPYRFVTSQGDDLAGEVRSVVPGKTLLGLVESLNKAMLNIELASNPRHGDFLYLSLTTWGVPRPEVNALRGRLKEIVSRTLPAAADRSDGGLCHRVVALSTATSSHVPRHRQCPAIVGMRRQRVDDELDVLVQRHAEPLDSAVDVLALHLRGEALVLELLLDARGRERADAVGPDQAAGHDEAGQLVAGQQRLVERG